MDTDEYEKRREHDRLLTELNDECAADILLAEDMKRLAKLLSDTAEDIIDAARFSQSQLRDEGTRHAIDIDGKQKERKENYDNLYAIMSSFYNKLAPIAVPFCYSPDPEHLRKTEPLVNIRSNVGCVETDGFVIIKTPNLLNKQTAPFSKKVGPIPRQRCFSNEVRRIIYETVDNMDRYRKKNVSIISVYPEFKDKLSDNDNLDYKRILDDICDTGEGGDGPMACSIFLHTVVSKTIQNGAYFVVSEGVGRVPDTNKMLEILAESFHV